MSSSSVAAERPHWHEYRLSRWGRTLATVRLTLAPVLVGLGVSAAMLFAFGLLQEQYLISDLLVSWGFDVPTVRVVEQGFEYLSRSAVGWLAVLSLIIGALMLLASYAADLAVSSALAFAALSGAPRTAVPTPAQVKPTIASKFTDFSLGLFSFVTFPLFAIVGFVATLGAILEGGGFVWFIGLASLSIAAALFAVWMHARRRGLRAHHERRRAISAHWTRGDEAAVWQRASLREDYDRARRRRHVPVEAVLGSLALMLGSLTVPTFIVLFRVLYPDAIVIGGRVIGGDLGTPTLSASAETTATLLSNVFAFFALAPVVLGVLAHAIGSVRRARGRAAVRRALEDPGAADPDPAHLDLVIAPRTVRGAQQLAFLAGMCLVLGVTVWQLSLVPLEEYAENVQIFGPYRDFALGATLLSGVLIALSALWTASTANNDRKFANLARERWIVAPYVTPERRQRDDHRHLIGPALTPRRSS